MPADAARSVRRIDGTPRATATGVATAGPRASCRTGWAGCAMAGVLPADTELQMVDTACSSSLYAIDIGIKGLLMGKQDIAVCGGAFALGPRGSVLFSKLQRPVQAR